MSAHTIIRTARGDIDPTTAGLTLFHEHLCCDWSQLAGDPDVNVDDPGLVQYELALAAQAGLGSVVDATTSDIPGRRLDKVVAISENSRVNVIVGCGYYRRTTYPARVSTSDYKALADEMIGEIEVEMPGTSIRAGVIGEIGSSEEKLEGDERKVFRAVAAAQRSTGVAVVTHTMEGSGARAQLDLLESEGVDPSKIAIGHLDCTLDSRLHLDIAKRGAFVGFDRVGLEKYQTDVTRVEAVLRMLDAGFRDRILLSGDLSRQSRMVANGGRGYGEVLTHFVPKLREAGVTDADLQVILLGNPARLLQFEVVA